MTEKLNCWEVIKCGLEPGGANVKKYGVCIAATEKELDGINSGKNAGRACWALLGTYCKIPGGKFKKQQTYTQKLECCTKCKFYELVAVQEDSTFKNTAQILDTYKKKILE